MLRALLVEDGVVLSRLLCRALRVRAHVDDEDTFAGALARLGAHDYDVVITELRLPDGRGSDLLARVRADHPRCHRALLCSDAALARADEAHERLFFAPKDLGALVAWVDELRLATGGASAVRAVPTARVGRASRP